MGFAPNRFRRDANLSAPSNLCMHRRKNRQRLPGFSLFELLCVMAIISILVSLMLPAVSKALRKARGVGGHLGSPGGVEMRIEEVVSSYTRFRQANPAHGKMNRRAFIRALSLSPAAETWLTLSSVEYRPFAASDPPEQPAIIVYPSSGGGSEEAMVIFKVGDLIDPSREPK
jgi:prepilin-type N-terminal cleavage/methylation domain-containing protein